ncbi:MAG: glycoside hydrolase family 27 protein [Edaphobacter sp.]|uniref:glycoside hydrolase family 27 protein n=1 Tax=Edaphobacter sp. TaxID=1934404 RepID=UPI00239CF58E|nr:glycoside hydrolase family 27 protein [Edaphobacter sp.]MDE1176852.1 glycoside hydrolase family 27 protein [Edaphobacter sp.]
MGFRVVWKVLSASLLWCAVGAVSQTGVLAPTPPMGWNSWDSYGLTIDEAQFKANVDVLAAKLKPVGYQYAVVDEGWYLLNPQKAKGEEFRFRMDATGRYQPAVNRYASAEGAAGFRPVADYVHAKGLKFGIHIIRGIPKGAVAKNTPIAASGFHAVDAADTSDTCSWNPDNFGVKDNAAGQAWYDALLRQYSEWGVDYIKVDCIASHPYKGDEIRMIHRAIVKATGQTHRPMVLSLSPGPAPLEKSAEVAANAQLWRISNDVWDRWKRPESEDFPQGVWNQFAVLADWVPSVKAGNWPDADMLPLGTLGPVPGWGKPRTTRLTEDEQRTLMTLWAMARSPLIVGANLTELDAFTLGLLTNKDIVAIDQTGHGQRQVSREGDLVVWHTTLSNDQEALAFFNLGETALPVMQKPFGNYGATRLKSYQVRDVWEGRDLGHVEDAVTGKTIPPHGCVLFVLSR